MCLLSSLDVPLHEVDFIFPSLTSVTVLLQSLNALDGTEELLRGVFIVDHAVDFLRYLLLEGEP